MYCHALLSEAAAGSSSAAAVGRHPEGAAYLSLAQIISDRAGTYTLPRWLPIPWPIAFTGDECRRSGGAR